MDFEVLKYMTLRIGILGGTFNPIHTGHCLLASGILAEHKLDYILFIPCAVPPHKKPMRLAKASYRLQMVKMAIKGNPSFRLSTIDLDRNGRSYSVDTICKLKRLYKNRAKFFFIMGSDSLREFHTWKEPDRLLELCRFLVVERPGFPLSKMQSSRMEVVKVPTLPISSTDIRKMISQGKSIKYLVPEDVRRYIVRHRLYCG